MDRGKWQYVGNGEWHIPDEKHPRGYRVKLSQPRLNALAVKKCREQHGRCGICGDPIEDARELCAAHKISKGNGGFRHDSHEENIVAAHKRCNLKQGSVEIP